MEPTALDVLVLPTCLAVTCGLIGGIVLRKLIDGLGLVLARWGLMARASDPVRRNRR